MALTPAQQKAADEKAAAEAKAAEEKAATDAKAKADEPKVTGYAAVDGGMRVKAVLEPGEGGKEPSAPAGTMLYPITEKTGTPGVGWSWSGEKYYPPAP